MRCNHGLTLPPSVGGATILGDPTKAAEVIGKTAQLTFHEVLDQVAAKPAKPAAGETYLPPEPGGQGFLRLAKPAMTGELVSGAEGRLDPATKTALTTGYDFLSDGASGIETQLSQLVPAGASTLLNDNWNSAALETALRP